MLKKRLIGVVTVKNGAAVQSFGYARYLPLGKPEFLVENLDRWGADEIYIQVIDRSKDSVGPDFRLLERIGKMGLKTPLIYGGGVGSISDGVKLVQMGADRIVVDSMLHKDLLSIRHLSERLGAQALIASLPLSWCNGSLAYFKHTSKISAPIPNEFIALIQSGAISEVIVSDWMHEGMPGAFEPKLIEGFPLRDISLIAFGGINDASQIKSLFRSSQVSAVAIGNFLAYQELAYQKIKKVLDGSSLRGPSYKSTISLLAEANA